MPGITSLLLPKSTQSLPAWQLAAEMLLNAAERGGLVMLAEIAMRRALNGKPTLPQPRRKRVKAYKIVGFRSLPEPHKRRLARLQVVR